MTEDPAAKSVSYCAVDAITFAPRNSAEVPLFVVCLVLSMLVWVPVSVGLLLAICSEPGAVLPILIWTTIGAFVFVAVKASFVAHIRGNGLLVSPDQLPAIHDAVQKAAKVLSVSVPEVYVVQLGGLREAIAKTFLGSRILVLSHDLLDDVLRRSRHVARAMHSRIYVKPLQTLDQVERRISRVNR